MPIVDKVTFQSSHPKYSLVEILLGDPKNIIWAAAHGHQTAISIDKFLQW